MAEPINIPITPMPSEYHMIAPDGKSYTVPKDSYDKAIKEGWTLKTPEQILHQEHVNMIAKTESPLTVGLSNFVNQGLMGVPEIIKSHGAPNAPPEDTVLSSLGLGGQTDLEKEAVAQAEKEHPVAAYGGALAGFGASLLYGGGEAEALGQGAERLVTGGAKAAAETAGKELAENAVKQSVLKTIGGSAVNMATQGALYSTPQALTHLAYGDTDKAAETLVWGIGTGAVLGGGLSAGGQAIKGGVGLAGDALSKIAPEGLKGVVDQLAQDRAGIDSDVIQRFKDSEIRPGSSETESRVKRMMQTLSTERLEGRKGFGDKWTLQDSQDLLKRTQKKLDPMLTKADKAITNDPEIPGFDGTVLSGKMREAILNTEPRLNTPLFEESKKYIDKILDTVDRVGPNASLKESQELINTIASKLPTNPATIDNKIETKFHTIVLNLLDNAQRDVLIKGFEKGVVSGEDILKIANEQNRARAAFDLLTIKQPSQESQAIGAVGRSVAGVILGGTIGHIGGIPGSIAGAALGAILEKLATKHAGIPIRFLKKLASDPATANQVGGALASAAVQSANSKISEIPSILTSTAVRGVATNPIKEFLGEQANGVASDKQYNKVAHMIINSQANPETAVHQIGALTSLHVDDPKLANAVSQQHYKIMSYLYNELPKDPNPHQPFTQVTWKPTGTEKKNFMGVLHVSQNPLTIIDGAKNGTLTQKQVQAAQTLYPKTFQDMVGELTKMAYDPKYAKLPYKTRLNISMITGVPMDRSLTMLMELQNNYSEQNQTQPKEKPQHRTTPHKASLTKLPAMQTQTQRREYGG